jgi:predicted lipid-binding transport protein (Tim44 family)
MRRFIQDHGRLVTFALFGVLLCALLVPGVTLARAGGGHVSNPGHSSGGGGFGGSSHSFGGSGGNFLGGAAAGSAIGGGGGSWCCTALVIIAIVVVIFVIVQRYGKQGGSSGGDSGGAPTPSSPADLGVGQQQTADFGQLKADDPNFSEQQFYGRVNEMFLAVQKAWEARNMEPARRFLSQEQFQVLQDGVGEYVRNGQINKLDSIHIDKITPVSVSREGDSDYVKVMIAASVIDYTIDERTGQLVNPAVLGDGKTVKQFEEYWTLTRKVGAQSKADATITKCPNCGAPVTDGNYVKCAYCGTMMNDPALDWVLLRIEQP